MSEESSQHESFVPTLVDFRNADTNTLIDQLNARYSCISVMNASQVVAGAQTLFAIARCRPMDDQDLTILKEFLNAFRARAIRIFGASSRVERASIFDQFEATFGVGWRSNGTYWKRDRFSAQ